MHNKQQAEELCSCLDLETSWTSLDWLSLWNYRFPQEVHKWAQVTAIDVVLIFLTWFFKNYLKWVAFYGHRELAGFFKSKCQCAGWNANYWKQVSNVAFVSLGMWWCVLRSCTALHHVPVSASLELPTLQAAILSKELNHRPVFHTSQLHMRSDWLLKPWCNLFSHVLLTTPHHLCFRNGLQDSFRGVKEKFIYSLSLTYPKRGVWNAHGLFHPQ